LFKWLPPSDFLASISWQPLALTTIAVDCTIRVCGRNIVFTCHTADLNKFISALLNTIHAVGAKVISLRARNLN
jgi:hypothetical protein